MEIANGVFYVGVNDHDIDLFEGQYIVPNGMAYNSYIIMDEKIAVMDSVDATLLKTHGTIDLVDKSIEKVQAPLDTAVKVSGTVDKAHDATLVAAKDVKEFVVKNAGEVKDRIAEIMKETSKETDELKEPSPEDIIGG